VDAQPTVGPSRVVLALVAVSVGAVLALISASGVAYVEPQGAARLREVAPALLASVVVGVTTVAIALALIRRSVFTPWLLLGALPAAVLSLNHGGFVG
jgi:hypothetical protein